MTESLHEQIEALRNWCRLTASLVDGQRPEMVREIAKELSHATHVETPEIVDWKLDDCYWHKVDDIYDAMWVAAFLKQVVGNRSWRY